MSRNNSKIQHIVLARHIETEKNLQDIHGSCSLDSPSGLGYRQAKRLAGRVFGIEVLKLDGVVSTKTKQAIKTAKILAELLNVDFAGELDLLPYNIGVASGLSNEDLRKKHRNSFISLCKFRARLIDAKSLQVTGAEDVYRVESRLLKWWSKEHRKCINKLIIGSNSTVLMLSHMLDGVLPTSDNYKFLGTPNGTMRYWYRDENSNRWLPQYSFNPKSWPEVNLEYVQTDYGNLAASFFHPGWDVKKPLSLWFLAILEALCMAHMAYILGLRDIGHMMDF